MRWYSLACCFLYSPLALAVQAPSPSNLVHDGYRLRELPSAPALRPLPAEASATTAGCGAVPAAPPAEAGTLEVLPLVKDRFFNKFFQGGGRLFRLVTQQQGEPRAVVVHTGAWTLPRLVDALKGQPDILLRQGNNYLLRVPMLLESGTSLVVREGESLRLSRERGTFIISMGTLYLRKARLEGWEETRGKPVDMAEDGGSFQSFVVGWSGSQTVISESTVAGLGFGEHLAQGLTLAVGPQGLAGFKMPPPARANIQDSHFEGMYSAVHATAIPDLRLCRNQFIDSRLHAIHLDDGSSGLILRNKVTATRGAYGLYFNKGVNNVQVLENDISENRRSGISISESRDIILAGNEIRQNFDAIFLQDADQILLADNRILDNQRHGLSLRNVGRIRLQGDQIGPNRGVGILARPGGNSIKPEKLSLLAPVQPASAQAEAAKASQESQGGEAAMAGLAPTAAHSESGPFADDGGEGGSVHRVSLRTTPSGPALHVKEEQSTNGAVPAAWRPTVQKIEMLGVTLDGNHSSALVIERPYAILLDKVSVMYPGVRRRPVFRGVLNYFESDILKRLTHQQTLLVEPGGSAGAVDGKEASKGRKRDK